MDISALIYALILGVVQGITEFLPVSSSAHLIIVSWFFQGDTLPLSLNVALHIGTLVAVLIYFKKDWWAIADGVLKAATKKEKSFSSHVLLPGMIIGSIPAGVIGLLWKDEIERFFHNPGFVVYPLAIVGVALWLVDLKVPAKRSLQDLSIRDGFLVGLAQACALIPGTSRSGATILGGRLLGFDRESAARFSFLLGTPAMLGAALLEAKNISQSLSDPVFYIGFVTSIIVGILSIHFLLEFVKRFGLAAFAIYRVILAISLFFLVN
ncbi:undecaprenyl-diphosphatase UppP [Pseudobacteriovorax antillogorgiicola]|uniref:Undecaprenyl-diphosphatase n=1 Tax=Pseudobacteriovorax antillogorgiicola TaxID=1513793 RepID=A0A1Y6B7N9_9BACT|nr:undecaprenyl-diphosphatase UppP [Pseudobacteriovorax antillogorgiicola]TCS59401.1 undecaprenyl-diphosphatase [Pseudobacteriovorax antillogorgiicola]SME88632.1 undecaprenyl-diphosphatase [Pseudobacteriovorax antillogorgiicola]